jgi:hypothetical protein
VTGRRRLWLDTETHRLPPGQRPWEIALIEDVGGAVSERVIVVLDIDLTDADPKSLAMNGFHDRHPLGIEFVGYTAGVMYLPAADAAAALDLCTADAEIVAAQPGFDLEGIAALLREHGFRPRWHYRTRCIESETAGFLQRDVGGLQDCAKQLGIPVDPTAVHSALGDARLVRGCWEHIFRREATGGDAR